MDHAFGVGKLRTTTDLVSGLSADAECPVQITRLERDDVLMRLTW
jgi:hypothetical protein